MGVVENAQGAIHSGCAACIGKLTVGQLDVLSPLWALCQPQPERALKMHQRVMLLTSAKIFAVRQSLITQCWL